MSGAVLAHRVEALKSINIPGRLFLTRFRQPSEIDSLVEPYCES
jgi:hypothetical protein